MKRGRETSRGKKRGEEEGKRKVRRNGEMYVREEKTNNKMRCQKMNYDGAVGEGNDYESGSIALGRRA